MFWLCVCVRAFECVKSWLCHLWRKHQPDLLLYSPDSWAAAWISPPWWSAWGQVWGRTPWCAVCCWSSALLPSCRWPCRSASPRCPRPQTRCTGCRWRTRSPCGPPVRPCSWCTQGQSVVASLLMRLSSQNARFHFMDKMYVSIVTSKIMNRTLMPAGVSEDTIVLTV